jgi:hypothetical protein
MELAAIYDEGDVLNILKRNQKKYVHTTSTNRWTNWSLEFEISDLNVKPNDDEGC